ncbi:hypothetical protein [Streptomyces longisporoflavus]|uniref:hypothetical protein n=1 Tax=Streptomyces longisporoflavus TaxID=28044 RepID=UPI00167E8192|nr:hypothetical protein [Streptomyces longisporoflavus]
MSRNTTVRRSARIMAGAMALGVLAACGGTESDGDAAMASASAPTGTLTAEEIEAAMVDGGDVPDHQVGAREKADRYEESEVGATQPECVVQARMALGMSIGDPVATAQRTAMGNPRGAKTVGGDLVKTTVTLATYKGKGKDEALYDMGTASTACRQGFILKLRGKQTPLQSPQQQIDPERLDFAEEFGWYVLTGGPGSDVPTRKVLIVGSGHTLGFFSRTYPGADAGPEMMPFPVDVARAQWKKLAAG